MLKFLLKLLTFPTSRVRLSDMNQWARLEFGRDALISDLDERCQ